MTDTINDVAADPGEQEPAVPAIDEQGIAEQLVAQAREKGIELVGPNGLLSQLTKRVLESRRTGPVNDRMRVAFRERRGRVSGVAGGMCRCA
jgi:putative transposase